MACAICETRRPRRFCPGVRGDICTICCGTEREVSVNCPLDCEYLEDARAHERTAPLDPSGIPNQDIRVTDEFLRNNEALLAFASGTLLRAALDTPGAVDADVREALDALVRTYRTLQSGVYYETRPGNPLAAGVQATFQAAIQQFRQSETQRLGLSKMRDTDVLGVLVFLQRLELDRSNGRRRGRAFLDFLRHLYPSPPGEPERAPSPLIVP
jgi:hypothetical protein